MNQSAIVITTTGNRRENLEQIARALVESRLAACVQIGGPIESWYRWQGQVESSTEWQCVIKTAEFRFTEVQAIIHQMHDYDVPQVIATRIANGSPEYLEWLRQQVDDPDSDD